MKFVKAEILTLIMTVAMLALVACSGSQELKLGDYVSDKNPSIAVSLQEGNMFQLNGPADVSLAVTGTYSVRDGKLFFIADGGEEYLFSTKDDILIFENGAWFENWVEQGTEFHLSNG